MPLELLILGSNSAIFAHGRNPTSQLLKIQDIHFLIDCGEGTQLLLKKNKIKLSQIHHILISHLHGDHYFGLIGLLSTMHLLGRTKDLVLIGPPGLNDIIRLQFRYSDTSLNYKVNFTEFIPEIVQTVFEDNNLTISTLPMDHRIPCSGYLFREKPKKRQLKKTNSHLHFSHKEISEMIHGKDIYHEDKSIKYRFLDHTDAPYPSHTYAFCADTKPKHSLTSLVQGTDLMYHEATFANSMATRAANTFHSTAKQAANFAKEANVKKLLLGHFSSRYKNLSCILSEAKAVFDRVELALEGQVYKT